MARIGSLLFLIAAIAAHAADPRVTVVVQPNPVSLDDSLQMRVEVAVDGGGDVSPPSFDAPDFTVVGKGSSSSFSTVYEGGQLQTRQRKLYTFVLAPKREGVHKISGISVFVGGKEIRSHDIAVKVLPGGATNTPSDGEADENPAAPGKFAGGAEGVHPSRFNSDFTVFLRLSKKQAYAGEPVVAEYYIYSPGGIQQVEIKKWPSFNGFWKEDLEIPSRYEWEPVYVNGQRMLRVLVGKFALYPIKPGKIRVDQLLITARYVDRSRMFDEEDAFNLPQIFGNVRVGTHSSAEETVEVLPLPEAGRPEGFSGAVGQFRANLSADKKQVPANSPVSFEFTVEGTGNFHAIEAPKLGFPQDFELYESKASFQLGTPIGVARRLENRKVFSYLVLPRKEGSFTVPPVKFSWFDVGTRSYKTI
ncbi:MAG: protein BatD, partial [Bdellovibrionales bacterium]|nr:protein BatD [Bdellovibrionales bacterium]